MSITKRFLILIALGIPILMLGGFLGGSRFIFVAYNLFWIGMLFVDYLISPSHKVFDIQRLGDEKLSHQGVEMIKIRIRNNSDWPITVQLQDELPYWHFDIGKEEMKGIIAPHHSEEFAYEVMPKKRGAFQFGQVHVRYRGRLQLCTKQFAADLSQVYKVYPNLQNLQKYRLLIQKNKFLSAGSRPLKALGMGTEFESLREYVQGDEYRKVNWMATARERKLIVNQYEPEKNQQVMILLDTGRGMSYSIKGIKKLDYAINASLLLSDIVNYRGDQTGMLAFGSEVQTYIKPGKGHIHRNQMMEALYNIPYSQDTPDYQQAFYHLVSMQKRRSLVCIFTSFGTVEEAEDLIKFLPILSKKHLPMVILMKNEELNQRIGQKGNTINEIFEKGVALELMEERKKIIRSLNKQGILTMESSPDHIGIDTINQYLRMKNKMAI